MQILYKQLVVVLFLSSFTIQTIGKGFFIVDYYLNTSVYAKNCVNKLRPKLMCNGKCQLMKKLQEEEKKEQKNKEKELTENYSLTLINKNYFANIENIFSRSNPLKPLYRGVFDLSDYTATVFHPPC